MLERLSFCPETTHEKKNMRICLLFVSLLTLSHCGEIQFTDCGEILAEIVAKKGGNDTFVAS